MRMSNTSTSRARGRQWARELPLVLVVIALLLLSLPLVQSFNALANLADDVETLQNRWFLSSLDVMQALVSGTPSEGDLSEAYEAVEELLATESFSELGRFSQELRSAMAGLSAALEASFSASSGITPEGWLTTMGDINSRFIAIQDILREIELQRERTYRSMGSFALILVLGFSLLYGYQVRKVRALARERDIKDRMAHLAGKVQEDERRSLARELHDGTAQRLAIARMAVDRVADPKTKAMLQESLTQAIEEVRLVAYHMRPVGHSTDKPAEMIRELALYFEDRYPLRFELLLRSDLSVDWEQEDLVHLYRIAQEALTNVVRHAEASRVSVELQYTSEGLVYLRVADNGKGLGKANEEGLGRHGMRERAELLGGTIRWKSEEGRGTEVELIVSPEGAQERGVRVEDFSR